VSNAGVHDASGRMASDGAEPTQPVDDTTAVIPADDEPPAEVPDLEVLARPGLDDPSTLRAAIEAVLFVVEAPITVAALATALERPAGEIEAAIAELASDLDGRGSGVELREVAGGVRLYTRSELAAWVEAFLMEGQRARLTQASLETLTVIAYRQPVTRARISAIRGVNVDGVVRTLTTRGLITEVGADPDTGGGLYRTTDLFLEKMGLCSLDELPSLAPLLPELDGAESDEL
jgi:segregation and condensation protein B